MKPYLALYLAHISPNISPQARGWDGALFMKPSPGANGVTRCEATAELKKETLALPLPP